MATDVVFPRSVNGLAREIADVAGLLWDCRWAERSAGNMSIDVTDEFKRDSRSLSNNKLVLRDLPFPQLANAVFLLTSTGSRMRDLAHTPEKFLGVIRVTEKLDGYRILWEPKGGFAPTGELLSHLMIHQTLRRKKSNERAVLHAHPDALIAMTHIAEFRDETRLNAVLWGMHPEATLVVPGGAGIVPYLLTGSKDLAHATAGVFETHTVALWEKHGAFAVGQTMTDAFDAIDTLEKSARIYLLVKSVGRTPEGLNDDQLVELRKAFFENAR